MDKIAENRYFSLNSAFCAIFYQVALPLHCNNAIISILGGFSRQKCVLSRFFREENFSFLPYLILTTDGEWKFFTRWRSSCGATFLLRLNRTKSGTKLSDGLKIFRNKTARSVFYLKFAHWFHTRVWAGYGARLTNGTLRTLTDPKERHEGRSQCTIDLHTNIINNQAGCGCWYNFHSVCAKNNFHPVFLELWAQLIVALASESLNQNTRRCCSDLY